ncbi:MAG: hypothetical protein ABI883_02520 [Chthoniobacterales bacterium]
MNDFSELEAELQQLRPTPAAPELAQRIERALLETTAARPTAGILPRRKTRFAWFALGLGAAAAAAFVLLARVNVEPTAGSQMRQLAALTPAPRVLPATNSGLVPDGFTRVLYNTRNEGLVFPTTATEPVRRVRSRTRETLQWRDPRTGASLHVSYPTEEVDLIPVSGQ